MPFAFSELPTAIQANLGQLSGSNAKEVHKNAAKFTHYMIIKLANFSC